MGYKDEQRETVNRVINNASYNSSAGPKRKKKRGTREDFVEDVAEAVRKGTKAAAGKQPKKPKAVKKKELATILCLLRSCGSF